MLLQPDLPWNIGPNNEYDVGEKVLHVKSTFYSSIIGALESLTSSFVFHWAFTEHSHILNVGNHQRMNLIILKMFYY